MLRADRDAMEAEVEASIRATNAECEAELARRWERAVRAPMSAFHPFADDLAVCAETNS